MRKYIFTAVIPITLFFLGIGLTLTEVYKKEGNFFNIQTAITRSQLQFPLSKIHAGNIVRGTFIAKYNNLGIISVRFTTHFRINEDSLIFRIKNQNSSTWFYQNTYKTDQFQPNQLFPFGFPPFKDSKGKAYVFELESVSGSEDDSVSINTDFPIAMALYSSDKHYYFSWIEQDLVGRRHLNPSVLKDAVIFIVQKTYAIFVLGQYTTTFLLYFTPLPIYIFWYWILKKQTPLAKKFISSHRYLSLTLLGLFLIGLFLIKNNSNYFTTLLILSWIGGIIFYKSSGNTTTKTFISRHSSLSLIAPVLIVIKALFIKINPDFMTLVIVLLWFTAISIYKFKNILNIYLSLIFLGITIVFYSIGVSIIAEQAAAWTIVFFGFTIFYDLYSRIRQNHFLGWRSSKTIHE